MMTRASNALVALSFLALAACSASSSPSSPASGDPSTAGSVPAAFSKYCTGTLKRDVGLEHAAGNDAWSGDGKLHAPSGTVFVLSSEFGWGGYVFMGDGSPTRLESDFAPGFAKDVDFTSDCAPSSAPSAFSTSYVLLAPATFYATADMKGAACALDAGTELTQYSFESSGTGPAKISSSEIAAKCGPGQMYSPDVALGYLIPR